MQISSIATPATITLTPQDALTRALELMDEHDLRHLVVVDQGRVAGVISERDLLEATGWDPARAFAADEGRAELVRDHMQPHVETVGPDDDVETAAGLLADRAIGCAPVVNGEKLVGILTEHDLLSLYLRACRQLGLSGELDPPVVSCMSRALVTIDTQRTVRDALTLARGERVRHLPVVQDGWFVGWVSDRDLRLAVGRRQEDRRIDEIMAKEVIHVTPDDSLSAAAELLSLHKIGAVAVSKAGKLHGLVSSSDVLRHMRGVDWDDLSLPGA